MASLSAASAAAELRKFSDEVLFADVSSPIQLKSSLSIVWTPVFADEEMSESPYFLTGLLSECGGFLKLVCMQKSDSSLPTMKAKTIFSRDKLSKIGFNPRQTTQEICTMIESAVVGTDPDQVSAAVTHHDRDQVILSVTEHGFAEFSYHLPLTICPLTAVDKLSLKVIELESELAKRDGRIRELEAENRELQAALDAATTDKPRRNALTRASSADISSHIPSKPMLISTKAMSVDQGRSSMLSASDSWDEKHLELRVYKVSDLGFTLSHRRKNKEWHSAFVNGIHRTGKKSVSFLIDESKHNFLLFGICESTEKRITGHFGCPLKGIGYCSFGSLWFPPSVCHSFGTPSKQGDRITVTATMESDGSKGSVSFSRNGELIGRVVDLTGKMDCSHGIRFAVQTYHKGDQIKLVP